MNITIQRFLATCVVSVLAASPSLAEAEEPDVPGPQVGVKAEWLRRTPPKYPRVELERGRQGWVILSYVVTTDGKVVDPVVQDSSGSASFEKAALRTVEDWTFKPATWNGEPVQQCDTKVMLTFAIEDQIQKVSQKFFRIYRKIDKMLLDGELEPAAKMLDETFESFDMTLSEISWLWALRARYAGQIGDNDMQLAAVRKATAGSGKWVDDDLYPGLLLIRTIRELESGDYSSALESYDKLLSTGSDLPQIELMRPAIEKVESMIASDALLSVPGRIPDDANCMECEDDWHYDLLRRRFTIEAISGNLRDLEIRCQRQRVVDKVREDISWEIPASWGSCSVIVFGEPGAKFTLFEEPTA
jgi:TonB family protein